AHAPRLTTGTTLNQPPNFPIGARAPARMTGEVMAKRSSVDCWSNCTSARPGGRSVGGRRGCRFVREVDDGLAPGQSLVDDGHDLFADQLVGLDQRVPERVAHVAVLGQHRADAFLLR